jgi:hypothetical protein
VNTPQKQQRGSGRLVIVAFVGIAIVLVLVAVAGGGLRGGTSSGSGVPWEDYNASLKGQIDSLARSRDCAGLQAQFDAADANHAATPARTGHNNAELMKYIDGKMSAAGCY